MSRKIGKENIYQKLELEISYYNLFKDVLLNFIKILNVLTY